jgi:hypothetical protein
MKKLIGWSCVWYARFDKVNGTVLMISPMKTKNPGNCPRVDHTQSDGIPPGSAGSGDGGDNNDGSTARGKADRKAKSSRVHSHGW